jgi:hypothetical protein
MEHVRGRILDGDTVLHENLDISVSIDESPSGHKSFHGFFGLPLGPTKMMADHTFRLALEDGRSGEIVVKEIEMSSNGPTRVRFTGSGPLS